MSQKYSQRKKEKIAQIKKQRAIRVQRNITVFALLILLIIGLVSTTFSAFISDNTGERGSLIADIQTVAVKQNSKSDIVDTKANVDVAQTSGNHGANAHLYFIKPSSWSNVAMIIGHGSHSNTYQMSNVSGNLYYLNLVKWDGWSGWGFIDATGWGSSNESVHNRYKFATHYTALDTSYELNANNTYIATMESDSNNSNFSVSYYSNGYSGLNSSQTAHTYAAATSSTSYSANANAGTIQINSFAMTDNGTGSSDTVSNSSTSTSVSRDAAQGTIVTMTATAKTGYEFEGWYSASSGGTCHSTSTTYTYTCSGTETVYARFKQLQLFEVGDTIYFDCHGSTGWAGSTYKIYVQCNKSTSYTGVHAEMTKIGTYLYQYTFTSTTAVTDTIRIWRYTGSAGNYTTTLSKSELSTYNGINVTGTGNGNGTKYKFTLGSINTPTCTVSDTDIVLGESVTISSSTAVLTYTRGSSSLTTTPLGATYKFLVGGSTVQNSSATSSTWTPTACGTYSITAQVSGSTVGKSSSTSTAKTVTVRPADPTKLTLNASNTIKGTGTSADPYIVYSDADFTLSAAITTSTSGAVGHYSTSSTGVYSADNTFEPDLGTKVTAQPYTVYGKAWSNSTYSTNYASSTVYYKSFTRLNGDNTGFSMSDDDIDDTESITFSNPYVDGVADAELAEPGLIVQNYQVSTDNSAFTDIAGSTWTPNAIGTYYFRLKTTNTVTGQVVYSASQSVTVVQSTVYYSISVVRATGSGTAEATLKTGSNDITDKQILSNEALTLALARTNVTPSNYYFKYITVTDGTNTWKVENYNGNLSDTVVLEHVKGNVTIEYCTAVKPYAQPKLPTNASSFSFKYYSEGVETTVSTTGTYYIDYDTNISYSVTPNTGYYVQTMSGVTMGAISASTATGTKNNVTANVGVVTATLTANNTVTVNVDSASVSSEGASMTIDGTAHAFDKGRPLNYGATSTIVVTPPVNCYAVVSGNNVSSTIGTDGKATFSVTLEGANLTYTVKFVENPKIYMVQPLYGSVYVTDDLGNYYFNGDYVGYGTQLTVNAKVDNENSVLESVLVNDVSIGEVDGLKFEIYDDSTATANITVSDDFTFGENEHTKYGTRRIFFTDNKNWGNGNVLVHYSNTSGDTDFSKNNITMTRKYQNVYYADIPFSSKYVTFLNSAKSQYSDQGTIANSSNAFCLNEIYSVPYEIATRQYVYSDYVATDRLDTIQQAVTSKGEAAIFEYSCDFGDGALSAEVVSGNAITYDFHSGKLSITPTVNTYNHSLVKVTSSASTTVKYYLIRVESFEIVSFTGLQKIYNTSVFNNIQLDLILKGGILNYYSKLFISDTNTAYPVDEVSYTESGFEEFESLEAYINSFLVEYAINSISGVRYYQVEASDSANHKATATMKTLFGTNNHTGDRTLYFYNDTNVNIDKYNLRACFFDADNNYTWSTMQRVGKTGYYRATVPSGFDSKVNFYLCNKNTFSNNYENFDGVDDPNIDYDDTTAYYSFGVIDVDIPTLIDGEAALKDNGYSNIVYSVSSISVTNGIEGQFADFDY